MATNYILIYNKNIISIGLKSLLYFLRISNLTEQYFLLFLLDFRTETRRKEEAGRHRQRHNHGDENFFV